MAILREGTKRRGRTRRLARAVTGTPLEQVREHYAPGGVLLPWLLEVLDADYQDRECVGHRTAVNAVLEALEVNGVRNQLNVLIWQRVGASDEAHAQRLIGSALAAQDMDEAALYREAKAFVEQYERERALRTTSRAVVVEPEHNGGNGNGNGHNGNG